ncbi:hypothetical protein AMAG_12890 [Allomyces macrogynus ATCC 38327]|uniref:HAP1 N-terminal domain-containing protein n=1 Tax=Allomyces macrogynus (strain ATCC 38327) TaxID=578462 RepID=A0A0L0T0B3_ALLM3|nr:hypothetical protein AMAG_12890 [Allomyces macrogynus ATCC 38327]|eukprot:KNE68211.1 hypothetical protein AMAG_12890 [Allomyces macrogynus ATCC 38327]
MLQQVTDSLDMSSLSSALAAVSTPADKRLQHLDEIDEQSLRDLVKDVFKQVAAKERDLVLAAQIGQSLLDKNNELQAALAAAQASHPSTTDSDDADNADSDSPRPTPAELPADYADLEAHNADLAGRIGDLERALRDLRNASRREVRHLAAEITSCKDRADAAEAKAAEVAVVKDRLAREKLELKVQLAKAQAAAAAAAAAAAEDEDAGAPEDAPVPVGLEDLEEEMYALRDEREALSETNQEMATRLADALTKLDDMAQRYEAMERTLAEYTALQDSYKLQAAHITELSELVETQRRQLAPAAEGDEVEEHEVGTEVVEQHEGLFARLRHHRENADASNASLIAELERAWAKERGPQPPASGFSGLFEGVRSLLQLH